MGTHLKKCRARIEKVSGLTESVPVFHLVVSARYVKDYFLHLEVHKNASLEDLDTFLRGIWLECCGHLSAFTIDGVDYDTAPDSAFVRSRNMSVTFSRVVEVGSRFEYEYDFGSTTHLNCRVLDERRGIDPVSRVSILARNEAPVLPCVECGKTSAWICSACVSEGKACYCDPCMEKHETQECGDEYRLPVVNSPRLGVCGYTG